MDRPLKPRGRRRRRSGAAMVEAVIVLSVLAVILLGVLYLPSLYREGLSTLALTRRCALQHAVGGCDLQAVPPECAGLIGAGQIATTQADSLRATADTTDKELPMLSRTLDALFGSLTWARARRAVSGPRPPTEDDRDITVGASFHVLCNSQPTSPGRMAADLFHEWVGL